MRGVPASERLQQLVRRVRGESGQTLGELVAVLAIVSVVLTGLSSAFVSASVAQVDLRKRVEAQQEARLALDLLRREGHCASGLAAAAPGNLITFTFGAYCQVGQTASYTVTWCTAGGGSRWALRRIPGTTSVCTGGRRVADYLTQASVFSFTPGSAASRSMLGVDFRLSIDGVSRFYRLRGDVVLLNTPRA